MIDRSKPIEYWKDIYDSDTEKFIMETYVKDNSGHFESAINNEIRGLFFLHG
jgi:hypothetical protein